MGKIKAIIFDLDDTLIDTTGTLMKPAFHSAVKAMIEKGLKCAEEEGVSALSELALEYDGASKFTALAEKFDSDISTADSGKEAYYNYTLDGISLFSGAEKILDEMKKDYKIVLVSSGKKELQERKIDAAGIRDYFDRIFLTENLVKDDVMASALSFLGTSPKSIICVGDKIKGEIKSANKLGIHSIRVMTGLYSSQKPVSVNEKPDFEIKSISELSSIIEKINIADEKASNGPKIALIGGGTGTPTLIEGLKKHTKNISAVITITDRGRSSGILHRELGIIPPGDVRNNIIALAESEEKLNELFQYRFDEGSLKGHALGNLILAALTKITGNFQKAIKEVSRLLNLKGGVYPGSLENTEICAELEDGSVLKGEQAIVVKGDAVNTTKRSAIKRAFIEPDDVPANPGAVERINDADVIVIGPGSLYSSVVPNLLIKGIKDAIEKSNAKKVYVCNIVTQAGQTDNYTASDHIKAISGYIGEKNLDFAIVNSEVPEKKIISQYEESKSFLVENDRETLSKLGVRVIEADLIEDIKERKLLWEKENLLRHDSDRISEIIINIAQEKI